MVPAGAGKPTVLVTNAADSASSSEDELALETPHPKTHVRMMSPRTGYHD